MENPKYRPMPRDGWEGYYQNGNPNNCMLSPKDGFCKICRKQKAFDSRVCDKCFRKLVKLDTDATYCRSCGKEEQCRTTHCKVCHKRTVGIENHICLLTNDIKVAKIVFHFECYEDSKGVFRVVAYEGITEGYPEDIFGESNQIRIAKAYRYIRSVLGGAMRPHGTIKTMEVRYSPEKVLKTWALLYLIPDDNVPCKNIRPLDLIADKESLFSTCETTFKAMGI